MVPSAVALLFLIFSILGNSVHAEEDKVDEGPVQNGRFLGSVSSVGSVVGGISASLTKPAPKRKLFHEKTVTQKKTLKLAVEKPQDEKDKDICSKQYWNMASQKSVVFYSQNYGQAGKTYGAGKNCSVIYQGSRTCIPVISCETPINLRKKTDDVCKEDYLLIEDGLGGELKYCDNDKFTKIEPSNHGKDFYVKFVTGPTEPESSFTGFKCTVSCKPKNSNVTALKSTKPTKKHIQSCVCGFPQTKNNGQRIVGGKNAEANEFPWLVAIVVKGTRQPVCGGAIINDRHILTAAHCFVLSNLNASNVDVLVHAHLLDATISGDVANVALGEKGSIRGAGWDLEQKTDADEKTSRYTVDELVTHPMFNDGYDNDVAIMKLTKPIDLESENGGTPICLPKHSVVHKTYKGKKGIVAGWGLGHEDASASNRLLQKLEDIPIIDHEKCHKLMLKINETISEKMMCAGFMEGGKDTCTGDSGGPFIVKEASGQFTQIGIVSWGAGCANKDSPGVYTDLQELGEWVNFHTSDPGVQWCREAAVGR